MTTLAKKFGQGAKRSRAVSLLRAYVDHVHNGSCLGLVDGQLVPIADGVYPTISDGEVLSRRRHTVDNIRDDASKL